MSLRFTDGLPVIGYREVADRTLAFAWQWREPIFRVTFTEHTPRLICQVTHLDCLPRLRAAQDNLAWLNQDDPARRMAILDHAINLWRKKDDIFGDRNT
jgi:hypothetical protein